MKNIVKFITVLTTSAVLASCMNLGNLTGSSHDSPNASGIDDNTATRETRRLLSESYKFFKNDIPIPTNSTIALEPTFVMGGGNNWIGRLVLKTNFDQNTLFEFYSKNMPKFGWNTVTSIRSNSSVLTYQRAGRVATIQLREDSSFSSAKVEVVFVVSPENLTNTSSSSSAHH